MGGLQCRHRGRGPPRRAHLMYSNRGWSYSSPASSSPTTLSAYRRRRLPKLPRLPALGPLPLAVVLVGAAAWYHFVFGGFELHGAVTDSATGQPIAGARVWSMRANSTTAVDGSYSLASIKPPEIVAFDAPGYRGESVRVTLPFDPVSRQLEPIGVDIAAVDADSGRPVSAALDGAAAVETIRVAPVRPGQKF